MASKPIFQISICALLGLITGFIALAVAVSLEPTTPSLVVTLLSPGLKIAELIMPQEHGSLATMFGWFLRIAIVVNTFLYFAVFCLLAILLRRRSSRT